VGYVNGRKLVAGLLVPASCCDGYVADCEVAGNESGCPVASR